MAQKTKLKAFAAPFADQRLVRLANGTKGATLEAEPAVPSVNLVLADIVLLSLEIGTTKKSANAVCKQMLRFDPLAKSSYTGDRAASNLGQRMKSVLPNLLHYPSNFNTIERDPKKLKVLAWVLQQPWDAKLGPREWKLDEVHQSVAVAAAITGNLVSQLAPLLTSPSRVAPASGLATPAGPAQLAWYPNTALPLEITSHAGMQPGLGFPHLLSSLG